MASTPAPSWLIAEDEETYHARSRAGERLSSGMLKTFADCPLAYARIVGGQAPAKDSAAFRFGRAVHTICIEGMAAFRRRYISGVGPLNPKTEKTYGADTKAFADWLEAEGLSRDQVLTPEEMAVLTAIGDAFANHERALELIASDGWGERVALADLHGVPCQARIDWLSEAAGIVDLKTTSDLSWFEADAKRYGYLSQLAFYRAVLREASGVLFPAHIIALEKVEPFRVGVWSVPSGALDAHETQNNKWLQLYRECKDANTWPTGYENVRAFVA